MIVANLAFGLERGQHRRFQRLGKSHDFRHGATSTITGDDNGPLGCAERGQRFLDRILRRPDARRGTQTSTRPLWPGAFLGRNGLNVVGKNQVRHVTVVERTFDG